MKIKILSDGTPQGTYVVDAATGERVENVTAVDVRIRPGRRCTALIEMLGCESEILAEASQLPPPGPLSLEDLGFGETMLSR